MKKTNVRFNVRVDNTSVAPGYRYRSVSSSVDIANDATLEEIESAIRATAAERFLTANNASIEDAKANGAVITLAGAYKVEPLDITIIF